MPGSVLGCIDISLVDDNIPGEPDKDFTVILSTADSNIILGNNQQTVTITDDDGILHAFI